MSGENLRQKVVGKENKVVSKKLDQAYIQLAPKRLSLIVEFQIKKIMLIIIFMMMIQFLSNTIMISILCSNFGLFSLNSTVLRKFELKYFVSRTPVQSFCLARIMK